MRDFNMYFINNYNQYFSLNYIIISIFGLIILITKFRILSLDIEPIILLFLFLILIIINYTNFIYYDYLNYLVNINFKKLNLKSQSEKTANLVIMISIIFSMIILILISKFIYPINNNLVLFLFYLIFAIVILIFNNIQISNKISKINKYLLSQNANFSYSNPLFFIFIISLVIALIFLILLYLYIEKSKNTNINKYFFVVVLFIYYLILINVSIKTLFNSEKTTSDNIYIYKNPQPNLFFTS